MNLLPQNDIRWQSLQLNYGNRLLPQNTIVVIKCAIATTMWKVATFLPVAALA
jgi:hypothetical protein